MAARLTEEEIAHKFEEIYKQIVEIIALLRATAEILGPFTHFSQLNEIGNESRRFAHLK